jgi:glutathione S-transferase
MAWLRSDLLPIREERSAEYVFYPHEALSPIRPLSHAALRAAHKLVAAADHVIPSSGGPLFGKWCIVDTELSMMLQRLVKTRVELPERIVAYAVAQWGLPAVREFCEHRRPPFERSLE